MFQILEPNLDYLFPWESWSSFTGEKNQNHKNLFSSRLSINHFTWLVNQWTVTDVFQILIHRIVILCFVCSHSSRQHLRNMEHLLNDNLLKYFTQYALMEGSTSALSIGGLKNLLQNLFAQYLKVSFTLIFTVLPMKWVGKRKYRQWCCKADYCAQMVSLTP